MRQGVFTPGKFPWSIINYRFCTSQSFEKYFNPGTSYVHLGLIGSYILLCGTDTYLFDVKDDWSIKDRIIGIESGLGYQIDCGPNVYFCSYLWSKHGWSTRRCIFDWFYPWCSDNVFVLNKKMHLFCNSDNERLFRGLSMENSGRRRNNSHVVKYKE